MREVPADLARKLVDAADHLGANFDDVRMDDIAQASGIPRATLYYYFSGKDDILAFLLDALLAGAREAFIDVPERDTRTRLTALVRSQLEYVASHPATAQLLTLNLGRASKLVDVTTAVDDLLLGPIVRVLQDGQDSGEIRDLDVRFCAVALTTTMHALGMRAILRTGSVDPDRLAADVVDLFWGGITTPRS